MNIVNRSTVRAAPRSVGRDEIVDAAIRVIDRDGPRPSMDDIAREAGITKPRLYRRFADKADLFTEIGGRMATSAFAAAGNDLTLVLQPPRQALATVLRAYADSILEHPNVFRFLGQAQTGHDRDGSVVQVDLGRQVAGRLARQASAVAEAVPIDDSGIDYLARAITGVVVSITDLWLGGDDPAADAGEFVDQTTEYVWGLIDSFLRRRGIQADPATPIFSTLAAVDTDR
ncbi:TetR/AcrR family transcriptional regulator [Nocardia cyriacigeorgica]|uniref:Putative transcriptional regulator, TetR family n=1 Tax=Nocardia cyriacigeorgica (strain GUH-2) TaxID=1127134 RepID=H6R5U0_NOCCG|nr:TetR/AcrR family transcriptional regulator [Nocardia cyriacigeorgica]BDT87069.1 putative transcriptional regulator, TetR family protein [Nocardia cyriacigeorgica]CCF63421.1 putative transcriptional regulator, TetR family [Nocardia cyriacigeorgica GUH-2]